jgi:hypothetical protein
VAAQHGKILLGDVKNPNHPVLRYTVDEWDEFISRIKSGEFDSLVCSVPPEDSLQVERPVHDDQPVVAPSHPLASRSARGAARLGAKLAGRKRSHLREAWLADLAKAQSEGSLTVRLALNVGIGYIICALRLRVADIRAWCRRALGFIVISPLRTHLAICLLLGSWIAKIFADQGFDGVTSDLVNFGIAWTAMGTAANRMRSRRASSGDSKESDSGTDKQADPPKPK